MDCQRARKYLAEIALGRAAPAKLDVHLEKCRDCSVELERLKAALTLVDLELEEELAIDVSPQLIARVRQSLSEIRPGRRPALRWQFAAASLAIVLTTSFVVMRLIGPRQAAETESAELQTAPPVAPEPVSPEITTSMPPVAAEKPPLESPPPVAVRAPEPAVLVPPGQEAAILDFYRKMQQGRIAVSPTRRAGSARVANLAEIRPLTIPPVKVKPLRLTRIEMKPLTEIEPLDQMKQRR